MLIIRLLEDGFLAGRFLYFYFKKAPVALRKVGFVGNDQPISVKDRIIWSYRMTVSK